MIGQLVSHHKILEVFREGDLGIVYLVQEINLIKWSLWERGYVFQPRATCPPILMAGALGLDSPSTITTLKGLHT